MNAGFLHRDFSRAALLVIDAQQQFCDPVWGRGDQNTLATARRIQQMAPAFRNAGLPVIAICYTNNLDVPRERLDFFEFRPADNDVVLQKNTTSAFGSGDCADFLERGGYRRLYMCGFNYSACLKLTATHAVQRGFDVTVMPDLSANDYFVRKDIPTATAEMLRDGIRVIPSHQVLPQAVAAPAV